MKRSARCPRANLASALIRLNRRQARRPKIRNHYENHLICAPLSLPEAHLVLGAIYGEEGSCRHTEEP